MSQGSHPCPTNQENIEKMPESKISYEQIALADVIKTDIEYQSIIDERNRKSREIRAIKRTKKQRLANDAIVKNTCVGSQNYPASKQGYKAKALPKHFNVIINNIRQAVFSGLLDPKTSGLNRAMSAKCRKKLFEVLVTIITRTELLSGQIGVPKADGFHAINHDDLQEQHAMRWGYSISSSTWFRYIAILKNHKILKVMEAKSHVSRGKVCSYAAYKWVCPKFLSKIGLSKPEIKVSVERAYQKAVKNGLEFRWTMVFTKVMRKKHDPISYDLNFDAPPPNTAFIQ